MRRDLEIINRDARDVSLIWIRKGGYVGWIDGQVRSRESHVFGMEKVTLKMAVVVCASRTGPDISARTLPPTTLFVHASLTWAHSFTARERFAAPQSATIKPR